MLQLQVLRFVARYVSEAMKVVWSCIHVMTNSHSALSYSWTVSVQPACLDDEGTWRQLCWC